MNSEILNVDEIENIIIAFANGEFNKRLEISENRDERDTIIAGINMLGEELEATTISRDYFVNIYNTVSDALIILDLNWKIIDANLSTEKLLKKSLENLKKTNINVFFNVKSLLNIKETFERGDKSIEVELGFKISEENKIPISCSISKIIERSGIHNGFLLVVKDITEQKNKKINDLKIVISTQETERKRLAYDLHDSLGQEIVAVKMYMAVLSGMEPKSEIFKETLETCKSIINNTLDSIRRISFDLLPKSLEQGGLIQAINELVKKIMGIQQIEYNYPDFEIKFDIKNQINIYRVIQEFINNSMKHNQQSIIKLNITSIDDEILLLISDNGNGFVMNENTNGNGLFNINSRLQALNAQYNYWSEIGKGTFLVVTIKNNYENN